MLLVTVSIAQETPQPRRFDFPRRHSIYLQNYFIIPVLYYDIVIPISAHFGFIPKFGIVGLGYAITIEPLIFVGGNKHYLEIGAGYFLGPPVVFIMNYRYMADRGFLFKVGFVAGGLQPLPILGIGYSF